jgi:hypothetical protein
MPLSYPPLYNVVITQPQRSKCAVALNHQTKKESLNKLNFKVMETISIQPAQAKSTVTLWIGRVLGWLAILFLLLDAAMKLVKESHAVEGTLRLGFSESIIQPLGVVLLVITILYIIPRTAILGAILLTAYMGGATATMVFAHQSIIFPVVFGIIIWGALYLRDSRLRSLIPLKSAQ